jgi:hypothetical protein
VKTAGKIAAEIEHAAAAAAAASAASEVECTAAVATSINMQQQQQQQQQTLHRLPRVTASKLTCLQLQRQPKQHSA